MTDPYEIRYVAQAVEDLQQLPARITRQVLNKIERLAENATIVSHHAMKGTWAGYFRIRVGDYRVIYRLDHERRMITIERIGHRGKVYRD